MTIKCPLLNWFKCLPL